MDIIVSSVYTVYNSTYIYTHVYIIPLGRMIAQSLCPSSHPSYSPAGSISEKMRLAIKSRQKNRVIV